jgi:hypothetical protein
MESHEMTRPAHIRVLARLDTTGDCWLWPGARTTGGYGEVHVGYRKRGRDRMTIRRDVHVVMYEHAFGPVPTGLEIDHLCGNRACARPSHLEAVTHQENMRRGGGFASENMKKTHCPQGHPYSDENTYRPPTGHRKCRECGRRQHRAWHARKTGPAITAWKALK